MEIPVPVPNTEVKHPFADDTAERWESRTLPAFFLSTARLPGHGSRFFSPGRNPPPPPAREKRPNFAFSRHGRHISRFSRFLSPTALQSAMEACFSCRLAAKFRRLGGGGHGLRPLMPVLALHGAASRASVKKIEKKRRTVLTFQCEK